MARSGSLAAVNLQPSRSRGAELKLESFLSTGPSERPRLSYSWRSMRIAAFTLCAAASCPHTRHWLRGASNCRTMAAGCNVLGSTRIGVCDRFPVEDPDLAAPEGRAVDGASPADQMRTEPRPQLRARAGPPEIRIRLSIRGERRVRSIESLLNRPKAMKALRLSLGGACYQGCERDSIDAFAGCCPRRGEAVTPAEPAPPPSAKSLVMTLGV